MSIPTGTDCPGAELVHRVKDMATNPRTLVVVNCAAMSDGVISSELFGHVRGAFSSAEAPRAGLVEEARAGTLFLDEIGDASASLQASLLRLLQEREARPVGADRTVKIDIRFVAATNRPLAQDVRDGRFREDLYARLSRCVVQIPPLCERREDILPLAQHFSEKVAGAKRSLHHRLATALLCHDWPGNVRSLQSTIERLVHESGARDPLALPAWLDEEFAQHARHSAAPPSDNDDTTVPEATMRPRARVSAEDLRHLLREHDGNITAVARVLDVTRNTIYRWIKKLDINLDTLRR
jgi:transcriptional regulator with GAF, ATPase, and Fis domain